MPREKFKTLTEQMFYILLCLHEECRGMDILEIIHRAAQTDQRIVIRVMILGQIFLDKRHMIVPPAWLPQHRSPVPFHRDAGIFPAQGSLSASNDSI